MERIRSFIAIELPQSLKEKIARYISNMRKVQKGIKWVKMENLHITLKFIGERSQEVTETVKSALSQIDFNKGNFKIEIAHTGAFPNSKNPRVIWLGMKSIPDNALLELQTSIEDTLEITSIERDTRRFSAHLTIGRVKYPQDFSPFRSYLDHHPFNPQTIEINSFSLIKSILKPAGPQYSNLIKYSLQ